MGSWRWTITIFCIAITCFVIAAGTIILQSQIDWFNGSAAQGLRATLVTIAAIASTIAVRSLRQIAKSSDEFDEAAGRLKSAPISDQLTAAHLLIGELRTYSKEQFEGIAQAQGRIATLQLGTMDERVDDAVSRKLTQALGPAFQQRGDVLGRLDSLEQRVDDVQRSTVKEIERIVQRIDEELAK